MPLTKLTPTPSTINWPKVTHPLSPTQNPGPKWERKRESRHSPILAPFSLPDIQTTIYPSKLIQMKWFLSPHLRVEVIFPTIYHTPKSKEKCPAKTPLHWGVASVSLSDLEFLTCFLGKLHFFLQNWLPLYFITPFLQLLLGNWFVIWFLWHKMARCLARCPKGVPRSLEPFWCEIFKGNPSSTFPSLG